MTGASSERRDDDLVAAEYVLGVLPQAERAAFARRLLVEPQLKSAVDAWEARLLPLLDDVAPVTPPAAMLAAVEQRLFPDSQSQSFRWLGIRFWQSLAAALSIALVALAAAYIADWPPRGAGSGAYVAELTSETGSLKLLTLYDPQTGVLRLNRLSGEPAAGRSFELWLLAGETPPVSLGLIPDAVTGSLRLPEELRRAAETGTLAVSDEPAGGSPTGQPTGSIVAAARLNSV